MIRTLLVAAPLLALPALCVAQPASPLARLAWLAGCWAADGGEPGSVEQWMAPAGGAMLGMSRTVRGGRVAEHEFLQIRTDAAGALEYVAKPSGQPGARFALVRLTDTEAVFENPGHDFPQRIVYAQAGPGRLAARIEGSRGGGPLKVIAFPMTRTVCDGPAQGTAP